MSQWAGWKGAEGLLFVDAQERKRQRFPSSVRHERTKYKNKKVWLSDGSPVLSQKGEDGKWHRILREDDSIFDSIAERQYYLTLQARERAGEISHLERQVPYILVPSVRWQGRTLPSRKCILDFRYCENGITVIEDMKSPQTAKLPEYTLKRSLFLLQHVKPYEPKVIFREVFNVAQKTKGVSV